MIELMLCAVMMQSPGVAPLESADAMWARRAEGSRGGVAAAEPIDDAIEGYKAAIRNEPADLEARWKLLRALRFKGAYVAMSTDAKRSIYDEARRIGDESLAILERAAAARGAANLSGRPESVARVLKGVPGAAELLHWDAAAWGEWALVYGKMAAVREGAAERIRRGATLTMLIDPRVERGGGARILGRLHDQTPRVPFVTGWASQKEAERLLRAALAVDGDDRLTKVFLAEVLAAKGETREARALLEAAAGGRAGGEYRVEESDAMESARTALRKLKR